MTKNRKARQELRAMAQHARTARPVMPTTSPLVGRNVARNERKDAGR